MKTNFLYFREHGKLVFTATAAQTNFTVKGATTLVPGLFGDEGFATAIADSTDLKNNHRVTITSAGDNTGNRGSDYASADTVAGDTTILEPEALTISSNDMVIANVAGDAQEGYDIKVGDIVTVELLPAKGNLGAFRADRFLSAHANSDTETEITFKAADGQAADDTITFTHADDDGVTFRAIANAFAEAAAGNFVNSGSSIVAFDAFSDDIISSLRGLGITNMLIASA
tara:strand:+ start:731 stop:1417 length:687 start_codon:yes stop_codon:yes gene_type:complete